MKLLVSIFIVIAMSFSIVASAENDSSFKKQKKTIENISTKKYFPLHGRQKNRKDIFIDKDGDGISDNCAKGMTFEKFRKHCLLYQKFKYDSNRGK